MDSNGGLNTNLKPDIDLGDSKKFVGYKETDKRGCHNRCVDILGKYGIPESQTGDKEHVFKLVYEKNGKLQYFGSNPKENYAKAVACIDRHLEKGRPIIVGVTHTIFEKPYNEGTTDHFVVIYGRKYVNGYTHYMYYEVGKSRSTDGHDPQNNVFKYDPDGPGLFDDSPKIYRNKRFDVSQVRPNDGDVSGTVSQYAKNDSSTDSQYVYGTGASGGAGNTGGAGETGGNSQSGGGGSYTASSVANLSSSSSGENSYTSQSSSSESSVSFGLDAIFGKVFPDDDNNRYIDMSSDEIAIIQYSEPVLKVEELKISKKNLMTLGINPDKIAYFVPVVFINDFMIPQTNITNFCLDYTSFIPQVMVEFVDMKNEMLSTNIPKPGSYIKVFIGGNGDEKYYKPIRQDFVITNINKTNKTGGEYQNYPNSGNPIKYKLTGTLNIPLGNRKMPWSSSKINARQAMFNLSNDVGIGFATNFNTNSDVDVMRWINTQNKSYFDFMKEVTKHSCYSPYTFFTSFIDQHYVLNFVECRRLLSHGGKKTDMPQMIYSCIMPEMGKKDDPDEKLSNGEQKVSHYILTNSEKYKGWTNYIEEYFELNDGYSMLSDGYKKTITYSDKSGFAGLMSKNYKFVLTPVDNLKRDENKNIISLPESVNSDTYIPLNLRQTTSNSYVESQNLYDDPTAAESTLDMGEVDTSNVFPLYFYASAQNDFQMKNFKKCGLSVRLQNYNPSITRYSRIWLDIYDMHRNSSTQLKKDDMVDKMSESKIKDVLKKKNDNIIVFDEETKDLDNNENQTYNRSLSGWYVVTDMKISYNNIKDFKGNMSRKLQTQLVLNRIEYKPSFYSEYDTSKKAVEKYKNDNLSENIMSSGDCL